MNEQVGKITWSPDYDSSKKVFAQKSLERAIVNTDSVIEKLLDKSFDLINRDWMAGDEGYDKVREGLKKEFQKILGTFVSLS